MSVAGKHFKFLDLAMFLFLLQAQSAENINSSSPPYAPEAKYSLQVNKLIIYTLTF
jgi:hypothetical protein